MLIYQLPNPYVQQHAGVEELSGTLLLNNLCGKYNFKLIMDSIEEYARSWAKQEDVELDTLSEWVKSVKHLLKRRIYMVSRSVNTKPDYF